MEQWKSKWIMNEKEYVEELISSSVLPDNVSPYMMISYLVKYYYKEGIELKELTSLVCEQMGKFDINIKEYEQYKAELRVRQLYQKIVNGKIFSILREYEEIPIYQSEVDKIEECKTDKEKKLLFTIYVVAKYENKYGWVYTSSADLFKLANISGTSDEKEKLLGKLIKDGRVKDVLAVDKLTIGVDLGEHVNVLEDMTNNISSAVIHIKQIKDLGNAYMVFSKNNYKTCEYPDCYKIIKIKNNRQKYCTRCAKKVNIEKTKERVKMKKHSKI